MPRMLRFRCWEGVGESPLAPLAPPLLSIASQRPKGQNPENPGFSRPLTTPHGFVFHVFDYDLRGGFLAELVSLIRDDLLDTNAQEFEGRHVMAGDKHKEQTTD